MQTKNHWEKVYTTQTVSEVSWYQEHSDVSLELIKHTGIKQHGFVIDIGGGASTLVDDLLSDGFANLTVVDVSATALHVVQNRLGIRAESVTWLEGDITNVVLPSKHYDLWHDRAVFHFLTRPADRARYIDAVRSSVKQGGHVIIATFGLNGPLPCSGLDVVRYYPEGLHQEFGESFQLIEHLEEVHHTPFGTEQQFVYCCFQKDLLEKEKEYIPSADV